MCRHVSEDRLAAGEPGLAAPADIDAAGPTDDGVGAAVTEHAIGAAASSHRPARCPTQPEEEVPAPWQAPIATAGTVG